MMMFLPACLSLGFLKTVMTNAMVTGEWGPHVGKTMSEEEVCPLFVESKSPFSIGGKDVELDHRHCTNITPGGATEEIAQPSKMGFQNFLWDQVGYTFVSNQFCSLCSMEAEVDFGESGRASEVGALLMHNGEEIKSLKNSFVVNNRTLEFVFPEGTELRPGVEYSLVLRSGNQDVKFGYSYSSRDGEPFNAGAGNSWQSIKGDVAEAFQPSLINPAMTVCCCEDYAKRLSGLMQKYF